MSETTGKRKYLRSAVAGLAAVAAAAGTFIAGQSSASADDFNADCNAVAVAIGAAPASNSILLANANPQVYPCASDSKSLVSITQTIIPAHFPVPATKLSVSGVKSTTFDGYLNWGGYTVRATSDIASLTLSGPGYVIKATGVHSDSTVNDFGSFANASVATLTVNGLRVNVLKNTPLTVPLGLRSSINVDATSTGPSGASATPLYIQFPDYRYYVTLAGSFVSTGCDCT